MKKIYERPLAEVIELAAEDIITASYGTTGLTEGAVGMGVKAGDTYAPNESDRLSITTN